jgi:large subunit ribosomal protein L23
MGLLDRWSKKIQTERLEKKSEPKSEPKTEAKPAEVKEVKKTPAKKVEGKAKKTVTKKTVTSVADLDEHAGHDHSAHEAPKKLKKIISSVILRALVTEKSAVKQSENKYIFVVANSANKAVIKKAIEEIYKVKPVSVNIINVQGKAMRFGNHSGKRSDFKKAIVTLPKGKTIVIHEGV